MEKQDIRMSARMTELRVPGEAALKDGVVLPPTNGGMYHHGAVISSVHDPSLDTWNRVMLAVLQCQDDHGLVAIPVYKHDSLARCVRFGNEYVTWLRVSPKTYHELSTHTFLVKAREEAQPAAEGGSEHRREDAIRVKSLPAESSGYRLVACYKLSFSETTSCPFPTYAAALDHVNSKSLWQANALLVFRQDHPRDDRPQFAILFPTSEPSPYFEGNRNMSCLVGPSIDALERSCQSNNPLYLCMESCQPQEVQLKNGRADVFLSSNMVLVFRTRRVADTKRSGPHGGLNMHVSVETRLPWLFGAPES
jgi:hypothetical protein